MGSFRSLGDLVTPIVARIFQARRVATADHDTTSYSLRIIGGGLASIRLGDGRTFLIKTRSILFSMGTDNRGAPCKAASISPR